MIIFKSCNLVSPLYSELLSTSTLVERMLHKQNVRVAWKVDKCNQINNDVHILKKKIQFQKMQAKS